MKKILLAVIAAAFTIGIAVPASATCMTLGCGLKPFTAETRYMSLAGYARLMDYQEHVKWITHRESVALVKESAKICAATAPEEQPMTDNHPTETYPMMMAQ